MVLGIHTYKDLEVMTQTKEGQISNDQPVLS